MFGATGDCDMRSLLAILSVLLLVAGMPLSANTLQFSMQNNSVNTLSSVTGTQNFAAGVSPQGVTSSPSAANSWRAEYGSDIVLVQNSDIATPIVVQPNVTLVSEKYGRVKVANGKVSAVTRTSALAITPAYNSYNYRPTLFISLCGASAPLSLDGRGNCPWQMDNLDKTLRTTLLNQYQYKHFAVDWDTHKPTRHQVDDLADVVKDFLNSRVNAWDVVIIGFSRGGIFAHELTEKIVTHGKVANLHTYLLDPTAASIFQDIYPSGIQLIQPSGFYGHYYYDNRPFEMDVGSLPGLTISDQPIGGYSTHYINSTHTRFPYDWFASSLTNALSDVNALKDTGYFPVDGTSGLEIVRITYPSNMVFDGVIEINNGQIHVSGAVSIGAIPGASTSFDLTVGPKRIEMAVALATATAHLIINEDQAAISVSSGIANLQAKIDGEGISASTAVLNLEVGVDVGWNGTISIDLGDIRISIDITRAINDFFSSVGNAINDLGDAIADVFGW